MILGLKKNSNTQTHVSESKAFVYQRGLIHSKKIHVALRVHTYINI